MTDPERATADAVSDQLDELLAAADGPPTSSEAHPPREPLDREQREIKLNVLRMGALVEDAIRAAIAALVNHDTEAALAVIVGDGRINEAQRAVSTQISRTIATQQPVARDLRFLLSLDHVTYELERIGDHAASVAKQARKLAPEPPLKEYDEIDALYHKTFAELIDLMRADPDNVERGMRILLAAHYLERIGDRVTNIAEDVVFLASGEVEDLNP
jgi:phosphate transport system protein